MSTGDEIFAKIKPPSLLAVKQRMRRSSFITGGGGEIQINAYEPGESASSQDRYWNDVAFESVGGFHFPNEDLDDKYYEGVMRRFSKSSRKDGFDGGFVEKLQAAMQEISEELAYKKADSGERRSVTARLLGGLGLRSILRRRRKE